MHLNPIALPTVLSAGAAGSGTHTGAVTKKRDHSQGEFFEQLSMTIQNTLGCGLKRRLVHGTNIRRLASLGCHPQVLNKFNNNSPLVGGAMS